MGFSTLDRDARGLNDWHRFLSRNIALLSLTRPSGRSSSPLSCSLVFSFLFSVSAVDVWSVQLFLLVYSSWCLFYDGVKRRRVCSHGHATYSCERHMQVRVRAPLQEEVSMTLVG